MKTLFKSIAIALFFFLAVSCQDQSNEVDPIQDKFANTEWSVYQTDSPDGKPVYRILRFKTENIVEIDYRISKTQLYSSVGEFTYLTQGDKLWVKNPDNTIAPGEIIDGKLIFGGESYTLDKQ